MSVYNYDAIYNLWVTAGGPTNDGNMATAIALAESGGDTNAVSSTRDVGLWQINLTAHPEYDEASLKNPMTNARAAIAISGGGSNWRPWCTAYADGACGTRGGAYEGSGSPYQRYLRSGHDAGYAAGQAAGATVADLMGPEGRFMFGQPSLPGTGAPYEPFPSTVDGAPALVTSPGRFGVGSIQVGASVPSGRGYATGAVPGLAEPQPATAPVFATGLPAIEQAARFQTRFSNEQLSASLRAIESLGP